MPNETIGLECEAYLNSGTWGTPDWDAIDSIIDVNLPFERNKVAAKSRGSTWEKFFMALKKGEGFNAKLLRDNSDTIQNVLRDAWISGDPVCLAFADGPIATAGTYYFKADFHVEKWNAGEPLEDVATIDASFVLSAKSSNEPIFVTVSA